GCVALSMIMPIAKDTSSTWSALLPAVIGLVFTCMGLCGMLLGGKLLFDRQTKMIIDQRRGRSPLKDRRQLRFDEVAAVQICSRYVSGDSDSPSYNAYEINLVLFEPEGARLNLTCHSNENRIRTDAAALAQHLAVPLLDHSEKPVRGDIKQVWNFFSNHWKNR
ncbi:MAG: hypothetical protein V2A34_16175, partial [Lentisphaerota bacterium]